MAPSILIADDDRDVCDIASDEFKLRGYDDLRIATTPVEAMTAIRESSIDLAIIDVNFTPNGKEGLRLISDISDKSPDTFIVVLSVVSNPEDIVAAMKNGADDYITKDQRRLEFSTQLDAAIRHCATQIEFKHLREMQRRAWRRHTSDLVGESDNIISVRGVVEQAHRNNISRFVVVGGSGTGKRAVSDYIVATTPQVVDKSPAPLIDFNCGSTTSELARSELFGVAPNSGLPNVPSNGRKGVFALAQGGYVLIDDFQELPAELHPAFLQVLERNEVKPIGGAITKKVDFRLIVTTQQPLDSLPAQIRRRLEEESSIILLEHLNRRRDDILPLAGHFLEKNYRQKKLRRRLALSKDVEEALLYRDYDASVGDLKNLIWRLAIAESGDEISIETYEEVVGRSEIPRGSTLDRKLDSAEKALIIDVISDCKGNVEDAAQVLGIDPQALRRRAKKYGISVGRNWFRRKGREK